MNPQTIILSRTDGIGDVVLTLPAAGLIKKFIPGCKLIFLGRDYTRAVIKRCRWVDECVSADDLYCLSDKDAVQLLQKLKADTIIHVFPNKRIASWSKKAGIQLRIGTSHRIWHRWTCNKRINFSRSRSDEHEAMLNLKLLRPLGIQPVDELTDLIPYYGIDDVGTLPAHLNKIIAEARTKVILHPGSKGSAVEWGIDRFRALAMALLDKGKTVLITGSSKEGDHIRESMKIRHPNLHNLCGQLDLDQLIILIGSCDAMVAASTGPLHLAAALGKVAVGLYAPRRPVFPQRWAPIGKHATYLLHDKDCPDCARGKACTCIRNIGENDVLSALSRCVPGWEEHG